MQKKRVEVDRPCNVPGVTFEEREGGRFCLSCREMQHDLTNATLKEALALIEANGGRICGTFRAGPTGEVRFRPEPPSRSGSAARGAVLALALAGCGSSNETPPPSLVAEAPPTSAPPPSIGAPLPPTTVPATSTVPATDVPPTSVADDATLHETDASNDVADHATHAHTHDPVGVVGIGGGGHYHLSGGASAVSFDQTRGDVQIGAALRTGGDGELDPATLALVIRRRQAAIRSCYERGLREDPSLAGEIVCSMTVSPTGRTSDVTIVSDTLGHPAVGACVVAVLHSVVAPAPEGGSVTCTVPFRFDAPDGL